MNKKSVAAEADEIILASDMIRLGARVQVLQSETKLSYERLTRLYKEIRKVSPPKGMLPYSIDWYMTWMPNVHSTLFYSYYLYLNKNTTSIGARALVDGYRLYLDAINSVSDYNYRLKPVLTFTRAWMLLRFFDSNMLQMRTCDSCGGKFINHAYEPDTGFSCVICKPPPRAGKTRVVNKRLTKSSIKNKDTEN